jgi:hypothetical protein
MLVQLNVMLRLPPYVDEDEAHVITLCVKQSRAMSMYHDDYANLPATRFLEPAGVQQVVVDVRQMLEMHPSLKGEGRALLRAMGAIDYDHDKAEFVFKHDQEGSEEEYEQEPRRRWKTKGSEEEVEDEEENARQQAVGTEVVKGVGALFNHVAGGAGGASTDEAGTQSSAGEGNSAAGMAEITAAKSAAMHAVAVMIAKANEEEHKRNPWKRPLPAPSPTLTTSTQASPTSPVPPAALMSSSGRSYSPLGSLSAPPTIRRLSAIMAEKDGVLFCEGSRILI